MLTTNHNCKHCCETHELEWDYMEVQEIQCSCGAIYKG